MAPLRLDSKGIRPLSVFQLKEFVWQCQQYYQRIGLQEIIREKSPEATYTPCFAHSLNLSSNEAAVCTGCTAFFDFVRRTYTFLVPLHIGGQGALSTISRANSQIRTSISDNRLNVLSLLCIESEVMHSFDFGELLKVLRTRKRQKCQ